MEASGTPASPAQPPAPPPAPAADDGKSSGGIRLLAVVLALALAFGAAVMIILPLNPDDTPRCDQLAEALAAGECFDLSKGQQLIQNILAWPAGILGAIGALLCLYLAATGRAAATVKKVTIPAVVLGLLAVVVGQV